MPPYESRSLNTKAPVAGLAVRGDRVSGVILRDGEWIAADACISTLPPRALATLLPPVLRDGGSLRSLDTFETSPIVSTHVWVDRPVLAGDFVGFVGTTTQWVYNRSRLTPGSTGQAGQYLSAVISAGREVVEWDSDRIAEQVWADMRALLPAAREARMERAVVVKEKHATIALTPAAERQRPCATTALRNFFLAGDWTDTGLPATIESAVLSGHRAAALAGGKGLSKADSRSPCDKPEILSEVEGLRAGSTSRPKSASRWNGRAISACSCHHEKDQAGFSLLDSDGKPLYKGLHPARVYGRFEDIPKVLVDALLYIENRELLTEQFPTRNPAVEWDRLAQALIEKGVSLVDPNRNVPGGSTLPTQIEKYRHSPEGMTSSMSEKLRQMGTASLRAYLDGPNTLPMRKKTVMAYLNTVPLAAAPRFGEVNGVGDGLWAWYGLDFAETNRILAKPPKGRDAVYANALTETM